MLLFVILLVFGFVLIYSFWPSENLLPKLGEMESFTMETVEEEQYDLSNSKVKLVMFYYTSCPDICPLTMMHATPMQEELMKKNVFGKKVEFVSITLDPDVDTKEKIMHYAESFDADFTGWKWLRGSNEKTKSVADRFKMMYEKSKDGFVAHNTTMYLLDKKNNIRAIYDMSTTKEPLDSEQILKDIGKLIEKE